MPNHYILIEKGTKKGTKKETTRGARPGGVPPKRSEEKKIKAEVNEAMKKKKISKVDYKNLRRINI